MARSLLCAPVEYPWPRVIGSEADGHKIPVPVSNIDHVSPNGIHKIEASSISNPDNAEGVL